MRIIFLTSGTGSTAYNISKKIYNYNLLLDDVFTNLGFVYEPNVEIETRIENLKKHNSDIGNFYRIVPTDFNTNEDFHTDIFNTIKTVKPNVIILAGWMHIIPTSFIKNAEKLGIKIINLHPTLQYQLIGRDIYPKIWKMYQEGMIRETGCIVHYVSNKLDRGEVIHELKLDLTTCATFEDYHTAMYGNCSDIGDIGDINNGIEGLEKKCLSEALLKLFEKSKTNKKEVLDITPATFSKVNGLVLKHRGKVRDIYEVSNGNSNAIYNDYLFVMTSDRISANDIVIAYLPQKGYLLNQINAFWHKLFGIDQMVCGTNAELMVIRKMRAIPLEIIVRRRITGSLWKAYSQNGLRTINGYELRDGMVDGDLFDEPIITPTTKGTHDIPITFAEIVERGILNKREMEIVRDKACGLFKMGENYMKRLGIEMIDTKFEFAFDKDGNVEIIDELFTPDSSRFIVDGIRMDKDILRRWANENEGFILEHPIGEDGCHAVQLPTQVANRLRSNYSSFLDKLLANQLNIKCIDEDSDGNDNAYFGVDYYNRNKETILNIAISKMTKYVVILAGSKSDNEHVEKIRTELAKVDILAFVHYSSAHKNTEDVMELLQYYENQHTAKIVYITCAGLSNALSGVVSANVSRPVIACPPFADKADYQVNIHSTLQMPSGVPSACIIRPDNVAGFCKRILFS